MPARPATSSLASTIEALASAPLPNLRVEWQRWHPNLILPQGLPRDLLVRSIAWQMQVRDHGGLTASLVPQLERLAAQLAKSGNLDLEREVRLKPGTRLIREWRGHTSEWKC